MNISRACTYVYVPYPAAPGLAHNRGVLLVWSSASIVTALGLSAPERDLISADLSSQSESGLHLESNVHNVCHRTAMNSMRQLPQRPGFEALPLDKIRPAGQRVGTLRGGRCARCLEPPDA